MKKLTFLLLTITIALSSIHCTSDNKVQFVQKENQIDVMYDGKLITSYLHGADLLKPALYPVNSPSGASLTRDYPFKEVEGESNDHPHHTGMYFTYASNGEVNGDSFWNVHPIPPQIKHIETLKAEDGILTAQIHTVVGNEKCNERTSTSARVCRSTTTDRRIYERVLPEGTCRKR